MKKDLLITGFAMIVVWVVFKRFYPYADYFVDSFSYIQAAVARDAIGYRPIGYSLFLRLVHIVSNSDTFLVTLQYLLVQSASLLLFINLQRLCRPADRKGGAASSRWVQRLILLFLALNPVIPYTCNYVSSDALFIALSLIWLNVLIGLILRPSWGKLGWQLLLLILIFNTRYVAMYYPAVAAIAFFLMRKDLLFKVTGIAASVIIVFIGTSVVKARTRYETGAALFSAFSGWQIANNALHIYPYLPVDTTDLPSAESRKLATYVKTYLDQAGPKLKDRKTATTEYMWIRSSPLHQYMAHYQKQEALDYFTAWNRVGVVFTEYGYFLIRKHPVAFGRYYIWQSAKSFFYPDLDVYAVYNEGRVTVDPVAQHWFNYRSTRVAVASATFQGRLFKLFPLFYLLLNIAFLLVALLFLPVRGLRERHPEFTLCFRLTAAYLLANAAFCIFASPTVFRYQVLPVILLFVFAVYGIHFVTCYDGDKSITPKRRS